MRYIHLALLFKNEQDCITKVARNVNENCDLIEDGWKYQTGEHADGVKIFAKPKDPLASEQWTATSGPQCFFNILVRGVGFEPTNLYRIGS